MQTEQRQTDHGGTGEQETELGSGTSKRDTFAETHPEDPDTLDTGSNEDAANEPADHAVRNPSGDDIGGAVDGDEGTGRRN